MKGSESKRARAARTIGDERWKELSAGNAAADGKFVYAVVTTGVYCRASCASRLPRPENVVFYASAATARRAGFRACKRCKPDESVRGASPGRTIDQTAVRVHGGNDEIHFATGECSLGSFLVARSGRGVCAILFGADGEALARDLRARFPEAQVTRGGRGLKMLVTRVAGLLESPATRLELPLDPRGTAFQRRVWRALRTIAPGETASYSDIAARIGSPGAVRAVARACAANALAVVIPCHRVVRNDGALSGYRWGDERKRTLLQREARA